MTEKIIKYISKAPEEKEDRVLRFIGSNEDIDRDGDVIKVDGWKTKNYKLNPVVMVNHVRASLPVAKTNKVWVDKENKALMFDIEFAPADVSAEGDTLYKLYKSGFMTATSVGFVPNFEKTEFPRENGEKSGPYRIFKEQELLEISLVSVPANPGAVMTSKSIEKAVEENIIDKAEAKSLEIWLKDFETVEEKEEEEELTPYETSVKELQDKVEILEKKVEELTKEEEIEEPEKSYIDTLYEEFKSASGTSEDEPNADANTKEQIYDEILKEYLGDNKNG